MLTLTDSAKEYLTKTTESERKRFAYLTVLGGGCSGFQYKLEFVYDKNQKDRIFEFGNVKLFVDPKSYLYLMGTEIDFIDEINQSGFKFVNPNAKRTCGCGESFSVQRFF